nr:hypothetical protein [Candidatus Sigynarchaeota archaeon]
MGDPKQSMTGKKTNVKDVVLPTALIIIKGSTLMSSTELTKSNIPENIKELTTAVLEHITSKGISEGKLQVLKISNRTVSV